MPSTPQVTIIMPVYNRAAMVREAIDSALAVSREIAIEIVVVDDASTDDTWAVLQAIGDPRVRPVRVERNGGQSAARNHGLAHARGAFVKFLDSDDLLIAEHLPLELRAIEGNDIAVSGWIEERVQREEFAAPEFHEIIDDVLAGRAVPTSAALYVRRDDWRWDPQLRKLDDWDFFCQAALGATRIATVSGAAYVWRHHEGTRATDATMLANALEVHRILHKIEERLAREGKLTEARRKRLAQYFYKELRVLSLYDRKAFDAAVAHIRELDPVFVPRDEERQWFMRAAARVLGFRNATLLHSAIKKRLGRLPMPPLWVAC
ncbi:MAG TPA: glycosyltransferase family 2 protein [Thermoanaerobaculia bacterium]|nr:glycosyltransferase family 2 protein [Thermoanaerobaculia bacterium]